MPHLQETPRVLSEHQASHGLTIRHACESHILVALEIGKHRCSKAHVLELAVVLNALDDALDRGICHLLVLFADDILLAQRRKDTKCEACGRRGLEVA